MVFSTLSNEDLDKYKVSNDTKTNYINNVSKTESTSVDYVTQFLKEHKDDKFAKLCMRSLNTNNEDNNTEPIMDRWDVWADNELSEEMDPVLEGRTCMKIGTFNTIEGFMSLWKQIAVWKRTQNCNFRIFRSGIMPSLEENANRCGGRWVSYQLPTSERERLWCYTLMTVFGERNAAGQNITGVVFCARKVFDVIQIWTDGGYSYLLKCNKLGLEPLRFHPGEEGLALTVDKINNVLWPGNNNVNFVYFSQTYIFRAFNMENGTVAKPTSNNLKSTNHQKNDNYARHRSNDYQSAKNSSNSRSVEHVTPSHLYSSDDNTSENMNAPYETEQPKPRKCTADDENYRIEKIKKVKGFLEDAEANPGKYSKREIRNSRRQLDMLERRQKEFEKKRETDSDTSSSSTPPSPPQPLLTLSQSPNHYINLNDY